MPSPQTIIPRIILRLGCLAALPACCLAAVVASAAPAGPLRDGDRVVFLGDTFFEREGQQGFIETALVASHASAALSVQIGRAHV